MIPNILFLAVRNAIANITVDESYILSATELRYGTTYNGYMQSNASYPNQLGSIVGQYFKSGNLTYRIVDLAFLYSSNAYRLSFKVAVDNTVVGDFPESTDGLYIYALNKLFKYSEAYSGATPTITYSAGFGWYLTQAEYNTLIAAQGNRIDFGFKADAPGSKLFVAGDETKGFMGEVSASSFITGSALANAMGITAGASQHSTDPWLKFKHNGKTLFVSRYPIRYGISWFDLNNAGVIFGDRLLTVTGKDYKVRLLTGAGNNPYAGSEIGVIGSETNDLIGNMTISGEWQLQEDSYFIEGSGSYTWTQETSAANAATALMMVPIKDHASAINGIYYFSDSKSDVASARGWRPVLELVEEPYKLSLIKNNQLLPTATNYSGTMSNGSLRLQNGQYVTVPSDAKYAFGTGDFEITTTFAIHSHVPGTVAATGTSVTTFLTWNVWLGTGSLNNYDFIYNNLTKEIALIVDDFDVRKRIAFTYELALNRFYNIKLERKAGVINLFVDGVLVGTGPFAHAIDYNINTPMKIGQRKGGNNDSFWYSDMTIKSLNIK